MNRFVFALLVATLNLCAHGSPMFRKKKAEANSPRYELMTQDRVVNQIANESQFMSEAATNHGHHSEQRDRLCCIDPMRIFHKKEVKKENKNFHSHLKNFRQINMSEDTGAVKITKSPSGKKDIYTAITKEQYYQHNPENTHLLLPIKIWSDRP